MKELLFTIFLRGASEHLIGDLEEESRAQSGFWLLRQVLFTWVQNTSLLEAAAANAFLVGFPLTAVIGIRRFVLIQIPFRESPEFTPFGVGALSLTIAVLAAWATRLLDRRWASVFMAVGLTGLISSLTEVPSVLTVAAFFGGSLATINQTRKSL